MQNELKLNLGCGGNLLDGWENHDIDVDIFKPLPWPDDSVGKILLEHCWEHATTVDALHCLDECHRILKPGGVLRLCVPVIGDQLKKDHARDLVLGHGHLAAYTPALVRCFLWMAGFNPLNIRNVKRDEAVDGHWKVIGREKDFIETYRVEAYK